MQTCFELNKSKENRTKVVIHPICIDSLPDNIDQTHGRVGRLAHGEGDVNVQVGQDRTLLHVSCTTCTRVITHRKLTLWTRVSCPSGETVAALGWGLEVGPPDSRLLQQYCLSWSDVSGGHHTVAHTLSVDNLKRKTCAAS